MVGLIILEADACSIIVQLTRRMRPSIQNYLKIFFYAKFSASQVNALFQALLRMPWNWSRNAIKMISDLYHRAESEGVCLELACPGFKPV